MKVVGSEVEVWLVNNNRCDGTICYLTKSSVERAAESLGKEELAEDVVGGDRGMVVETEADSEIRMENLNVGNVREGSKSTQVN